MVIAIEWKIDQKNNFSDDEVIDHKRWLPQLNRPNLFIESNGAKNIIDEENEYQYLIFKNKKLIYITR